jgi:hypothetical protein
MEGICFVILKEAEMPTMEYDRIARELEQVRGELVSKVTENDRLRKQVHELQEDYRRAMVRLIEKTLKINRLQGIVTACETVLRKLYQEHYFMMAVATEAMKALAMIDALKSEDAQIEGK